MTLLFWFVETHALTCLVRILYFSLFLSVTAGAAPLPAADADVLREQFLARQQHTKTLTAAFTQTLAMPGMRQPVVSTGTLSYRAPEFLRLDFTKPKGDLVLIVGDHLYLQKESADLEMKSLSDARGAKPFQALIALLRGQPSDDSSAYAAEVFREEGQYVLLLNRKQGASTELPKRIINRIRVDPLDIQEIFVDLPNGGTLTYRFDAVARNQPIDGKRFVPPNFR